MIDKSARIMMLDTETANDLDYPLVYDIGFEVFDLNGNTFASESFINVDIFCDKDFMTTAYYAEKVPMYQADIRNGTRKLAEWKKIKRKLHDIVDAYDVRIICAHNAAFDSRALNTTQRFITSSKYRYFLPHGMEWWDTLKMSRSVLKNDVDYRLFCIHNHYVTKNNQNRYTAEVIYKYLTGNNDFSESHTGLEDVQIERKIFEYCLDRMPDIDGRLWPPKLEKIAIDVDYWE